jgi:hypothetical protein
MAEAGLLGYRGSKARLTSMKQVNMDIGFGVVTLT